MSTTTVLEMPDAPMLDYNADSDFTMHATGHTQDWLAVETTMSDDSVFHREYSETVEIEMEQNNEDEITEYEMADGDIYGQDTVVELEDVDFADPSSMTSPQHISGINSPLVVDVALPQPASAEAALLLPSVRSVPPPSPHAAPNLSEVHPVHSAEALPSESFAPTPLSAASFHEPLALAAPLTSGEPDPAHLEPSTHVEDHIAWSSTTPAPVATTAAEPSEPQLPLLEGNGTDVDDRPEGREVDEVPQPQNAPVEASPAVENVPQNERVEEPAAQDASSEVTGEQAHDESSGGDPHEISDGVYIDPPPAVLLSVVSSSERVDYCLFNQPQSRSGSQSPNAHASSSTTAGIALLLSQRPTLYYEPLNNVFEAFHQEETIANIAEFADGELILEAYDLDLRISEENIHAGEVTLHELNILHDGIDLTGPLRLRLSAVPRFITRYHALRDQVAQLTVSAGLGEEPHPHEASDEASGVHLQTDNDLARLPQASTDDQDSEPAAKSDNTIQEASDAPAEELGAVLQSELPAGEDPVDSPDSHEQQVNSHPLISTDDDENYDEQHTEDEGAPVEYGTELPAEEAAESLDADEGHRAPDAEEGGDYTEYAEQPEDDDEDFGEALPEELGGQVDANDGQHEVLPDLHEVLAAEVGEDVAASEQDSESAVPSRADVETIDSHTEIPSVSAGGASPQQVIEQSEATNTDQDNGPAPDVSDKQPNAEFDEFDNFEDFEDELNTQDQEASQDDEQEEWGEYDDDDDGDAGDGNELEAPALAEDASPLSKQSSETLSTLSKRSRDEDEDDEDGDDVTPGNPPGSPDNKRLRVQ